MLAWNGPAVFVLGLRYPLGAAESQGPADEQVFVLAERLHGGQETGAGLGRCVAAQDTEPPAEPNDSSVAVADSRRGFDGFQAQAGQQGSRGAAQGVQGRLIAAQVVADTAVVGPDIEDDRGVTVESGNGVEEGLGGLGCDIAAEVQPDGLPVPRAAMTGVQFQHGDRAGGRAQQGHQQDGDGVHQAASLGGSARATSAASPFGACRCSSIRMRASK